MLLVQRDLPGLVAGASDPMNQVTLSMGVFNTEAWEAICIAQDNQTTNNQPKGPTDKWKSMLPTLLKLYEVSSQSLLPSLYTSITKEYQHEELPDFQGDIKRLASSDITYNRDPPVVSAKILRRLVYLKWAANNDTYFKGGLTLLHTIYVVKSQQDDLQRHVTRYNLLVGGNTFSYPNVDKLVAVNAHVSLPIKFSQVKRPLELYAIVCFSRLEVSNRWTIMDQRSMQVDHRNKFELDEIFESQPKS